MGFWTTTTINQKKIPGNKRKVTQTIQVKPGWKKGTKVTFEGMEIHEGRFMSHMNIPVLKSDYHLYLGDASIFASRGRLKIVKFIL